MYRVVGMMNGGLRHKETYYVTVTAVNKLGLRTPAYSKPFTVDNTPPKVRLRDFQLKAQHCNLNTARKNKPIGKSVPCCCRNAAYKM